jgi:SAM-dependent methyltransferase
MASLPVTWSQRPAPVQQLIDRYFESIVVRDGEYGLIGAKEYLFPSPYMLISDEARSVQPRKAADIVALAVQSAKPDKPVRILDLGTGNGEFLKEIKSRYPNRVIVQGIAGVDRRNLDDSLSDQEYLVGNIENLLEIPGLGQSFDIIFSAHTFMHLCDPLGAICRAYERLKPNGLLMIDHFETRGITTAQIKTALKKGQYHAQVVGCPEIKFVELFTIQKTKPHLVLPFKYSATGPKNPAKPKIPYTT